MTRRIRDIENHLERADARIERFERIEAVETHQQLKALVIKMTVGVIAVMCAVSVIYNQF